MPYETSKHDASACPENGDGWDTVNTDSKEVKDHHEEKADADRQVRVLRELEKEGDD